MNKSNMQQTNSFCLVLVLVLTSVATPAATRGGLSYSPEDWPKRWSSAIRQQQDGKYPTRQQAPSPPPELPEAPGEVSDQDLFFSPQQRSFHTTRNRAGRRHGFVRQNMRPKNRYQGDLTERKSAFAYYGMPALRYPASFNHVGGFPYGTAPPGIDPVLGSPGMGIPIMPGVPFGYPLVGYPYGAYPFAGYPYGGYSPVYPGPMRNWNPPFGLW